MVIYPKDLVASLHQYRQIPGLELLDSRDEPENNGPLLKAGPGWFNGNLGNKSRAHQDGACLASQDLLSLSAGSQWYTNYYYQS